MTLYDAIIEKNFVAHFARHNTCPKPAFSPDYTDDILERNNNTILGSTPIKESPALLGRTLMSTAATYD
jgi:hypothetical protein